MIIAKEQLSGEDVRVEVERFVGEHLNWEVDGYKCDSSTIIQVLMKAAIEGQAIESICEDLRLDISSNTVRERLNRLLDVCDLRTHEAQVNAGLVDCIPAQLPRVGLEMAIDLHDEPFYGKTPELRTYACRGEAKEGTTYFYRVASLYIMWRQVRITLAMTYVLPEDSNLSVVHCLLGRMKNLGFQPGVLYADKEFCEGPILRYLQKARIPSVLACPIRGKTGGTRALCRGRKAYRTTYTFSDGTTADVAVVPTLKRAKKTKKQRRTWLVYVILHLDWSAKKTQQRYRHRFGIESSYRQFGYLRARTTSRNPALRFLLMGFGFLLLNIWVKLRFFATRLIQKGPTRLDEDLFRLHRFVAFLRRAIERAIGTVESIPIYAP
jgi:putative transposase